VSPVVKKNNKPNILIIGLGNPYRNDDGVGFYVIDELHKSGLQNTDLLKMNPDGYQLMEAWKDREWVIIVDAAVSDENIGTINEFDALNEEMPRDLSPISSHSINLAETISLARTLDQLPENLHVFAIEARNFEHGNIVSPEVKKAAISVVDKIFKFYSSINK